MVQGGMSRWDASLRTRRSSGKTPSRYRAAAGKRTYAAVAADLGITAESLRTWVRRNEAEAVPGRREAGGSEAEEPARLRAENARLLKAEKEWHLEREILRRAAACFAREVK